MATITKDQFIIEMTLVDPINKIVKALESRNYRDCDVKWLDSKLASFIDLAAKTLHINGVMTPSESIRPSLMNEYAYEYYLKYFAGLLTYFKTI